VDIHRESSCNNESNSTLQLNWTYLDRSEQQLRMKYPNYVRMDGIAYNHASVTYDDGSTRDGKETFQCRMEDMLILITADQARVCREQLEYACSRAQRSVCPCYSLSDLVLAEAQIFDDEIILDREMSCVRPLTREEGQYGLFQVRTEDNDKTGPWSYNRNSSFPLYTVNNSMDMCHGERAQGEGRISRMYTSQALHCRRLMQESCTSLSEPYMVEPMCTDDDIFAFKRVKTKNCSWVAEDPKDRCRRLDRRVNKAVFESCRKTCKMCACVDDPDFRLGDPKKDCDWVKQDAPIRCRMENAAGNCLGSCSSKCCQDNPYFRIWGKDGCDLVKDSGNQTSKRIMKRNNRCARKIFANNCPFTCGRCPGTSLFL
jgi:hypothetical protein